MQFPIDLVLGSARIPSHFVFDSLSLLVGVEYYTRLRNRSKDPLQDETRLSILIGAAVGAVLGAKLLALVDAGGTQIAELGFSYLLLGGKTIVGALAGGVVGVELAKKFIGEKKSSGDLFTYPLILGMMIGRVGCFLTGVSDDTSGIPSTLPWAFDQGDGIPRHPTALYEILFLGILWACLHILNKRAKLQNGVLFRLFIVAYFVFRFCVDFFKPHEPLLLGLTGIQLVCLIFAAWYAMGIIKIQLYDGRNQANTSNFY